MDRIEQIKKFEKITNSLGFLKNDKDEYSTMYKKKDVLLKIFFGRYSEKPDIFIRFQDKAIPEQFSVSSILFIDELSHGTNTLKDLEDNERMNHLIAYFVQNSSFLLNKDICRERKKAIDKYIAQNF